MNIVVFSFKGGVSKSSISLEMALNYKFDLVTNDLVSDFKDIDSIKCTSILPNLKRLPNYIVTNKRDTVFDIGAMSGSIDPKAAHAINLADAVIIPTLTDRRSIDGTIKSIRFVQESCKNIFVIVNRIKKDQEFETIKNELKEYIDEESIFYFKETTFFRRLSEDKEEIFERIYNKNGIGRLINTFNHHISIYDTIIDATNYLLEFKK